MSFENPGPSASPAPTTAPSPSTTANPTLGPSVGSVSAGPPDDRLNVGDTLHRTDSLTSANGNYRMAWQPDGSLSVTHSDGRLLWSSGTARKDVAWAKLENDGSLDIFMDARYRAEKLWSTGSMYCNATYLRLEDDGSVAVYNNANERLYRIVEPDDKQPNFVPIHLYRPYGAGFELRRSIEETEQFLRKAVNLLGPGAPFEESKLFLFARDLTRIESAASISTPYKAIVGQIDKVKTILSERSRLMEQSGREITARVDKARDVIVKATDSLNTDHLCKAWAVRTYDETGATLKTVKLDPGIETKLLATLAATTQTIEKEISSVSEYVVDTAAKLKAGGGGGGGGGGYIGPGFVPGSGTGGIRLSDYGLDGGLLGGTSGGTGSAPDRNALLAQLARGLAGGSGGGSGGGGMDPMMLQLLASQLANSARDNTATGSSRENDRDGDEQRPERDEPAAPQDPPAPAPADPATTAEPDGTPPPVDAESGASPVVVDLRLPDGTVQKSTSTVAQAVTRELSNPNGSNAHDAYAGTSGQNTPDQPWVVVDTADLGTGDIVQWEHRSGIVVVKDDGLHAITSGRLIRLDPNDPVDDGHGGYGAFQGFFHPTGVDAAAPESGVVTVSAQPDAGSSSGASATRRT